MGDALEATDSYVPRGIIPFDTALFVEAAEDFADKVSHFTWQTVERFDGEFEIISRPPRLLTKIDLNWIHRSSQRLRAFLIDGHVEFLGCRGVLRGYLSQYWEEFAHVVAEISRAVPPSESGLLHPDQLKQLRSYCEIIKFMDGGKEASSSDTPQIESIDAWVVAQKNGVRTKSEFLATILLESSELEITPHAYQKAVVEVKAFPLKAYLEQQDADDRQQAKQPPQPPPSFAVDLETHNVRIGDRAYDVGETAAHYLKVLSDNSGRLMSDREACQNSAFLTSALAHRPRFELVRAKLPEPVREWINTIAHKGTVFSPPK